MSFAMTGSLSGVALSLYTLSNMKNEFNQEANDYWEEKTGNSTVWNDPSDAFRHAYVSARFSQYFGEDVANILGLSNEALSSAGEGRDAAMDVWNNKVGAVC